MKYLSAETAFYILVKAREFDVKVDPDGVESGSDAADDGCVDILEDYPDDPTADELHEALAGLHEGQLHELVALTWLGRGTYEKADWKEAYDEARRVDPDGSRTPTYLMGEPLLSDYLEEGLNQMGVSLSEFEREHL